MKDFFRYIDIPRVPDHLLSNSSLLEKEKNIYELAVPYYVQFEVGPELKHFLKSIFAFEFAAQYQIIREGLPVHKDRKRTECFNYLIEDGGDNTHLHMYHEDKETIMHTVRVERFRWHWINVGMFHGVSGLTNDPRLAITITPLDKMNGGKN